MSRVVSGVMVVLLAAACASAPPVQTITPTASQPTATHAGRTGDPAMTQTPLATPTPTPSPSPTPIPTDPAQELGTPGVLDVCLAIVGAPAAAFDESDEPVGYNVDFAREIAERLGFAIEFQQPLFDELIDLVESHACDISVSSQNITASRLERLAFVPYTRSSQPVVVASGNPASIDSLDDLCGLPVSATTGTTHEDLVLGEGDYVDAGLNDACTAAGQAEINLRTFEDESLAFQSLLDGDVMAYLGNPNFALQHPERAQYAGAVLPEARQGIAVALDHPALLGAVEQAVDEMIAEGEYRSILSEHLRDERSVDVVSIEDATP